MRRTTLIAVAAALMISVSACGASSKTSADGRDRVQVSLTAAGCDPARLELPPGPTTFEVKNRDASAVSEFEVLDGSRILGEVENLTPGLAGKFSLTLKPGTFTTYCPGGKTASKGKLVVTTPHGSGEA